MAAPRARLTSPAPMRRRYFDVAWMSDGGSVSATASRPTSARSRPATTAPSSARSASSARTGALAMASSPIAHRLTRPSSTSTPHTAPARAKSPLRRAASPPPPAAPRGAGRGEAAAGGGDRLEREAGARRPHREADGGHEITGLDRRHERAEEELPGRDPAGAAQVPDLDLRIQGHRDGRPFGGG